MTSNSQPISLGAGTLARIVKIIDAINTAVGRSVMWLAIALALVQFAIVVMRYVFSIGFIPMQELVLYLCGTMFMLGSGYALLMDGHVRVDVIYRDAGSRKKAIVDLVGCLVFLLPLCIVTLVLAGPFIIGSWKILEGSKEVSGIRGVFLLKSVILAWAVLLGLQGVALLLRALAHLRGETEIYPAAGGNGLTGD